MCGIVCAFDLKQKSEDLRPQLLEMSKIIRHRGPDWSGIYSNDKAILAHERLAIVDPASGKQPLLSADKNSFWQPMAKFTTIVPCANSLMENMNFKQKATAKSFWPYTKKKALILLMR